jgi:terminal uridylyltransferase
VRHARTQQGRKPHSGPNQQAPSGIRGRVEAPTNQSPTILQRPPRSYTHNSTSLNQQPKNPLSSPATLSQRPPQPHVHPRPQVPYQQIEDPTAQVKYLDLLASEEVPKVEITMPEMEEKETFRNYLEALCQKALAENYSGDIATINLAAFGSLASGFATPGSDMDLAVVPGWKDPFKTHEIGIDKEIPRLLEKVILDAKMGARLLTRTRVPILKVCQKPSNELHHALSEERQKWEALPEEEKYAPSAPPERKPLAPTGVEGSKNEGPVHNFKEFPTLAEVMAGKATKQATGSGKVASPITTKDNGAAASNESENGKPKQQHQRNEKQPWLREKSQGPLDFPKSGVGIQCDINFENPLGIHNTQLLRCYSMCDPRVRPMVLFVKAWAKQRKINSSYSGTLSSYGWVLMVLHYLVNIAQPAVCPNLQMAWRPSVIPIDDQALQKIYQETVVSGYAVRFWRNEEEILHAASSGQLTRNRMTIGELLRGFFQYYSSMPQSYTYGSRAPSFYWTNEVLSLRTPGGLRTKAEKGWTGAKTTISNGKEVRNRYLFSIEDPFEIDHNVARTVTHNGIVAIRDEFRRAWRILRDIGRGQHPEGGIFDAIVDRLPPPTSKEPEAKAGEGVEFLPIRKKPEVGVRDEEERVAIAAKTFTGEGKASTKLDGEGQE